MKSRFRIAAAFAAVAFAATALASDPTQPEVTNPAPAIILHGSGHAEAEALNADPNWPRTEVAAPAMHLRAPGREAVAGAILNDEPVASAAREPAAPRLAAR